MLFREISDGCSVVHKKHTNELLWVEQGMLKRGGTYSNQ